MPEFDRGFKSWAERTSISLRRDVGRAAHEPLPPADLSSYLDIRLLTPNDVPGLPSEHKRQLLDIDSSSWSAVALDCGGNHLVIYNPSHSDGRKASDVMHELAHVILGHEPSKVILSADGTMLLRSYNQKQEDEAAWLAGCLLLPREALLHIGKTRMSAASACSQYQVSADLLRYRRDVTGVNYQIRRWR